MIDCRNHKLNLSATCIQKTIRRYNCQNSFQKYQTSVKILQTWFRHVMSGHEEYTKFRNIRSSIKIIQCWYRCISKKTMTRRWISATRIQQSYRAYNNTKQYRIIRPSILMIQTWYRHIIARQMQQRNMTAKQIQTQYVLFRTKKLFRCSAYTTIDTTTTTLIPNLVEIM